MSSLTPPSESAWSAAGCGGLRLRLAGREVICRTSGALWIGSEQALVVADLHLEKGSAFARRGQMLPPYDTGESLGRLEAEVAALEPDVLIFLGDTFHDAGAEGRLAPCSKGRLQALGLGRTMIWVVGNHDRQGPAGLAGELTTDVALGGLSLTHEPIAGAPPGQVAGHLHPCAKVVGRGASVRRRCFVTDSERMILPAFGAYAGGLNVRDAAFAPLLGPQRITGVLGAGRVHAVGWASLRGD